MPADHAPRLRSSWWSAAALCLLSPAFAAQQSPGITEIDSVAMTVSDMDRAVEFYSRVLTFEKVSEHEVSGDAYEHLWGVFGVRVHEVRMQLGEEQIELLQFVAPGGRPIPIDSRSNDHWFQHVAVIVSDMRAAYARLRSFNVAHASSGAVTAARCASFSGLRMGDKSMGGAFYTVKTRAYGKGPERRRTRSGDTEATGGQKRPFGSPRWFQAFAGTLSSAKRTSATTKLSSTGPIRRPMIPQAAVPPMAPMNRASVETLA